ncbi:Unknown protein sequence [Pseudomonas syringae pv. maculicola]|nr:Unknown protein sequence [Pseudomonas syringae pv. maculicola]
MRCHYCCAPLFIENCPLFWLCTLCSRHLRGLRDARCQAGPRPQDSRIPLAERQRML